QRRSPAGDPRRRGARRHFGAVADAETGRSRLYPGRPAAAGGARVATGGEPRRRLIASAANRGGGMAELSNAAVATLLDRYGELLEFTGERSFRARAYHNAADAIRATPTALADLAAAGRLRDIPGIGEGIALAIGSILATGRFGLLDELAEQYPLSLLELTQLPGVGVKTASRLFHELGVADLAAADAAAADGRIRATKGMGAKLEATILAGLEALRRRTGRASIGLALPAARRLQGDLDAALPAARVAIAGSVRRMDPTVGDIDLVIAAADPAQAMAMVQALPAFAGAERANAMLRVEL